MTTLISYETPTVTDHGSIADHTFQRASERRQRRRERRRERRRRRRERWFGEHPAAS